MYRRAWWTGKAVGLLVLAVVGCRDSDPPPTLYRNLGTQDVPLLPAASVIHDVSLAKGSADWVPFRKMGKDEAGTPSEAGAPSGGSNAETETEIRELLKEYNELVVQRDIDELMVYHIDSHQETVKSWYEVQFALLDKVAEVQTALTSALPDSQARIEGAFAPFKTASAGLSVDSLTVESEELVVGKLAGGGVAPMCRFVIVDDEWFIDLPNFPETFAQRKAVLDEMMSMIDALKQGLESGTIAAEKVLTQLEASSASPASDKTSATDDNDGGEGSPDRAPKETKDDDSSPTASRHRVHAPRTAASNAADPAPDKPDAPKPHQAAYASCSPPPCGAPGLEVSPRGFFQNLLVQRQVRHRFLQPSVLDLKLLQMLGLVGFHPAVLIPPAVERRLGNLQGLAYQRDVLPLRQQPIRIPKLTNNLLRSVSLTLHLQVLLPDHRVAGTLVTGGSGFG